MCLYAGLHRFPAVCDILLAEYRESLGREAFPKNCTVNIGCMKLSELVMLSCYDDKSGLLYLLWDVHQGYQVLSHNHLFPEFARKSER